MQVLCKQGQTLHIGAKQLTNKQTDYQTEKRTDTKVPILYNTLLPIIRVAPNADLAGYLAAG